MATKTRQNSGFATGDRVRHLQDGRRGIVESSSEDEATTLVAFEGSGEPEQVLTWKLVPFVSDDYIASLNPLYLEVFRAFISFNPNAMTTWGVAYQSLYSLIAEKGYTLGEVRSACDELVRQNVLHRDREQFYSPTTTGAAIMAAIRFQDNQHSAVSPPPFSPPF